jgi:hypothetical protein
MSPISGRGYARLGFGIGISASIAGNVAHVFVQNPSPPLGAVISAGIWPVSLFIAASASSAPGLSPGPGSLPRAWLRATS